MRKTTVSGRNSKTASYRKYKKRKRNRRKKFLMSLKLTLASLVFSLCIIGIIFSLFSIKAKRAVCGVWSYDTVTTYQFEKNGNGNLILPDSRYPFTYLTDRKLLFMDFEEESLTDMIFQYSVSRNALSIKNTVTGQELILEKYE